MAEPQTMTIDGRVYDLADLNTEARQQITNIQAVDQEIAYLTMRLGICRTARGAYAQALQTNMDRDS